jgi:hypothetical protein
MRAADLAPPFDCRPATSERLGDVETVFAGCADAGRSSAST